MIYCYLRVSSRKSTDRQSTESQRAALQSYCDHRRIRPRWFEDYATGRNLRRQQLSKLLEQVQDGDTILVSDLSRFSRSVKDTLALVEKLTKSGVILTCLNPSLTFDQTAMSKFTLTLFAALSELESSWKGERIKNGLQIARDSGKRLGRLPDHAKRQQVKAMRKTMSVIQISKTLNVSPQAIYYLLAS